MGKVERDRSFRDELMSIAKLTQRIVGRMILILGVLLTPLLKNVAVYGQTGGPNPLLPASGYDSAIDNTTGDKWQRVEDTSFVVVNEPTSQVSPALEGNRVVWQDARLGPGEIFLKDLASDQTVNLTHSTNWESTPDIAGDVVVWRDGYDKLGIHGKFLSTGEQFTVATGFGDVSPPRLSDNYIVWAAHLPDQNEWHIYGFDLNTRTSITIADGPDLAPTVNIDRHLVVWSAFDGRLFLYNRNDGSTVQVGSLTSTENPDVSAVDGLIVWQDRRNGNWDIYGWDLTANHERVLVNSSGAQAMPRIANGLIAFQSQISLSSWNIALYDLASKHSFPITDNANVQALAVTDGTSVVWEDNRNHQTDIYGFTWTGSMPLLPHYTISAPAQLQVGAFPGGLIRLQWSDTANHESGYRIERADGITGTTWNEVATLAADRTDYQETPAEIGQSYWYRVRAFAGDDTSAYSNESFASTFDRVTSLEEQYLLTLINQARADPAAVGYPTYPAVAPLVYNPLLAYAARAHSQSILNSGFQFGHCDASGRCPADLAKAEGYLGGCSENLIMGSYGSENIANANRSFLDSQGHRNTMLDGNFKEAGMGHTFDPHKGSADTHGQITELICGRDDSVPIPAIPAGAVAPFMGSQATSFSYLANFYTAEGTAPTLAQVVIDGVTHEMSQISGQPANGTYHFSTTLGLGSHEYYFLFTYAGQQARWPESDTIHAPTVPPDSTVTRLESHPSACAAAVSWQTLGLATTSIEYGLTTAYGQTIPVDPQPASEHGIQLTALMTNTPYHFRIHATDTTGSEFVSADHLLLTRRSYTLQVPAQYPTIADALAQAKACDVVSVAPGDYQLPGTLYVPAAVLLMGAGPLQTSLTMTGSGNALILEDKSLVSGFTIQGAQSDYWASGVWFSGTASPVIVNNLIRNNAVGIANYCQAVATCGNRPLLAQNVLVGNTNAGIVDTTGGSQIINNTLVQNEDGIRIDAKHPGTVIRNNLIVHHRHWGIRLDQGVVTSDYNVVWGNWSDYSNLTAGVGDLPADPLFIDEPGQNFLLRSDSPARNAGDPASHLRDSDNTRNDMGATGGPFTSSPLQLSAYTSKQVPIAGDELTFVIELAKASINPESAAIRVELPADTQLVGNSIIASGAAYQVDGNQVSLQPTDLFVNSKVSLSFQLKISTDIGPTPMVMSFPITVESDTSPMHYDSVIFPNGSSIFLPTMTR